MIWIDYTIFVMLFFAALFGLASGPALQFLRICCLFISFFAALFLYSILSNILKSIFTVSTANLLSYFIIFGVAFIVMFVVTDIIKRILGKWNTGIGLRLFGGLLGILKGLIFCGVIIFGVLLFCSKPTCDKVNNSKVATRLAKGMQTVVSIIPKGVSNKIMGYAEGFKQKNSSQSAKPDKEEDFKSSP